ncbi:hypothetical protein [Streptomyces sp. NPDC021224]|uniref:hypothetical protein n=1 Tax=unclassified Streptomyces TaxID=2593676 RepID=UPI00378E75E6
MTADLPPDHPAPADVPDDHGPEDTQHAGTAGATDATGDCGVVLFDDVLATAGLYAESALLGHEHRAEEREATVTFVRPLAYRLTGAAAVPGVVDLVLCFLFDLAPLTAGRSYAEASLDLVFDDAEARALTLAPASGTVHGDGTRVSARGRGGNRLRWVFDPPPRGLRPDGHWVQAVLRLPADRTGAAGRISAQITVRRTVMGLPTGRQARTRAGVPFTVAIADAWPATGLDLGLPYAPDAPATAPQEPGAPPYGRDPARREAPGQAEEQAEDQRLEDQPWLRRLLLAVDVERYGSRHNTQMGRIQRDLWRAVRSACTASGIDWHRCGQQASGDGYLLVLPTGIDEPGTIVAMMRGLVLSLQAGNSDPTRPADVLPTRMRASLHQGLIREGHSGFLGTAVVDLFRVLDSAPLRTALCVSRSADLAVAWSDTLYRDLVPHAYPGLEREHFRPVRVEEPAKGFASDVWIRVHSRPQDPANPH